jgi:hypothetical protein
VSQNDQPPPRVPEWPDVSKGSRGYYPPASQQPIDSAPPTGYSSPSSRSPAVLVAASALVLAACGLGGFGLVALGRGGPTASRPPATAAPTATPSGSSAAPGAGAPPTAARAAKAGDCLHIVNGPAGPLVGDATCGPGEYTVVRRFDGTADGRRCSDVLRATLWYRWDGPGTGDDFVLCLRQLAEADR